MSDLVTSTCVVSLPVAERSVCWHCHGTGLCSCIACTVGAWGEPDPGPCLACRARTNGFEFESKPEVDVPKEEKPIVEPEWTGGFRAQVAKLLWDRGLKRKAIRFLNCNKLARPGCGSRYPLEHRYFIPNGCEVVFCKECADESRRELFLAYWHVVCNAVLDFAGERAEHERLCGLLAKSEGETRRIYELRLAELWARVGRCVRERGWVLWRVNFTLRSDGSAIIPKRVRCFNSCVPAVMRRAVRAPYSGVGCKTETPFSPPEFGMLFVDEVGFETRGHLPDEKRIAHGLNLHCHGLYFGPALDWEYTRDLRMQVTKKKFGVASFGFFYRPVQKFFENPGRAIRWALNHMLKYVSMELARGKLPEGKT